jgi:aminoglycoside 3-N-acetyltransferase
MAADPGLAAGADRARLRADLEALGLTPGRDLLVQCSMRRIGRIEGGAGTLAGALRDAAGPAATVVVPTQTATNSLLSRAFLHRTAGMSRAQVERLTAAMPGFDPASSASVGMGALAEHIRTRGGARRSGHPQTSFAAIGPRAAQYTRVHDLDCHLGERSPLGALYAADAEILLLGARYEDCTAFHLAEYRLAKPAPVRAYRCFVLAGGRRDTVDFLDIDFDDSDFGALGAALERAVPVRSAMVGHGLCRLVPVRAAVDFAVEWIAAHR